MVRLVSRAVAIGAVLLTLGGAKAWAGFEEGMAAAKRGDYATAVREWRPLADQGDGVAQYNLGAMYDEGLGVPQDYVQAVKWYRKAAEQGHASAQYSLGAMYAQGHGVTQDYVQAHTWFNLAGAQGDKVAFTSRDRVAKRMTTAQIAEAERLAREWTEKRRGKKE